MDLWILYEGAARLFPYLLIFGLIHSVNNALRISFRQTVFVTLGYLSIYLSIVFGFHVLPYLLMIGVLVGAVYFILRHSKQPLSRYILWGFTFSNVVLLSHTILEQGTFLIVYFVGYGALLLVVNLFQQYESTLTVFEVGILAFSITLLMIQVTTDFSFHLFFVGLLITLAGGIYLRHQYYQNSLTPHEIGTMVYSTIILSISTMVAGGVFLVFMLRQALRSWGPPLPDETLPVPTSGDLMSEFFAIIIIPTLLISTIPILLTAYVIHFRHERAFLSVLLVTFLCHATLVVTLGSLASIVMGSGFYASSEVEFWVMSGLYPVPEFSATFSTLLVASRKPRKRESVLAQ